MFATYTVDASKRKEQMQFFRSIVGNTFLIYNQSSYNILCDGNFETQTGGSFGSFSVKSGEMVSLEAIIDFVNGSEVFAFLYRKGTYQLDSF